ncbi:MAG: ABC transporter substrate-binding protein [Thioalkalispiraceae bacterium]|jgi:NitT/TauT family transport system substrate-binding protein
MLLITACSEPQQDKFSADASIAVSATPLSAPVFIAATLGLFDKYGLNVTLKKFNGGHICLNEVLDGRAHFGTASDYPIMLNSFKRKDFEVLASFVSSDNDVKLMANKHEIPRTADLKGKTIGVVKGASSHYFLDRFLIFNSLKLNEMIVRHVNPEEMLNALADGEVDAIAVWEPFGYIASKKLGNELNIFPAANYYHETFNLVALKSDDQRHYEISKRVLQALKESIRFIRTSPGQAQDILKNELDLDDKFIDWIWQDFDFRLSLDQTFLLTLENESRWAVEHGLTETKELPNYLEYVNTKPLLSVDPAMVNIIK